jgi:hypothetical protein
MGCDTFSGNAFYGYRVDTISPLRCGMLMEGRMKFEHNDIKLQTFFFQSYEGMIDNFDEDMICLLFGFSVEGKSAEEFFALKQTLDAYMKDAAFKGKELFEKPSFISSVDNYDYHHYHEDGHELENEDDKKEYAQYVIEVERNRLERKLAALA